MVRERCEPSSMRIKGTIIDLETTGGFDRAYPPMGPEAVRQHQPNYLRLHDKRDPRPALRGGRGRDPGDRRHHEKWPNHARTTVLRVELQLREMRNHEHMRTGTPLPRRTGKQILWLKMGHKTSARHPHLRRPLPRRRPPLHARMAPRQL